MKESGFLERLMGKESLSILKVIFTKVIGFITRRKDKGRMSTKMEISMMVNGRMTCSMVKERSLLLKAIFMKVSTNLARNMGLEYILG